MASRMSRMRRDSRCAGRRRRVEKGGFQRRTAEQTVARPNARSLCMPGASRNGRSRLPARDAVSDQPVTWMPVAMRGNQRHQFRFDGQQDRTQSIRPPPARHGGAYRARRAPSGSCELHSRQIGAKPARGTPQAFLRLSVGLRIRFRLMTLHPMLPGQIVEQQHVDVDVRSEHARSTALRKAMAR